MILESSTPEKEHAEHLIQILEQDYQIDVDWEGKLYCGITLEWDYKNKHVDISMPGYIKKLLQRFKHECTKLQHSPYQALPKKYGKDAQLPLPTDSSPKLDKAGSKKVTANCWSNSLLCKGSGSHHLSGSQYHCT